MVTYQYGSDPGNWRDSDLNPSITRVVEHASKRYCLPRAGITCEDVQQQTYINLLTKFGIDELQQSPPTPSYLYKATRLAFLKLLRRHHDETWGQSVQDLSVQDMDSIEPLTQLELDEFKDKLQEVFHQLPEQQKKIVHMVFIEERTRVEAAKSLNLAYHQVISQLRIAMRNLQKAFAENRNP
jgi:RNA polymerase sigma factor (sigma-70 family)